MNDAQRQRWRHLYDIMLDLSFRDPWTRYTEETVFACQCRGRRETMYFTFLSKTTGKHAVAIYRNIHDFQRARKYTAENRKMEPVPYLRNAIVGLWGDRADLSRENFPLVRELGYKFRGNGGWLYFEHFREGFLPVSLTDADVEIAIEGLENLLMMVRSHVKGEVKTELNSLHGLYRYYSEKTAQYYNVPYRYHDPEPSLIDIPPERLGAIADLSQAAQGPGTWLADWSYLPLLVGPRRCRYFPRLILVVDAQSKTAIQRKVIMPSGDDPKEVCDILVDSMIALRRPSSIQVSDDDLYAILAPICRRLNISLIKSTDLPMLDKVRAEVIEQLQDDRT